MSEASEDPAATAASSDGASHDSADDSDRAPALDSDAGRLKQARDAYEAGDFRRVRELVHKLSGSEESGVAAAAGELGRRVGVDPVQAWVLAGCLLLFCGIVYAYFGG